MYNKQKDVIQVANYNYQASMNTEMNVDIPFPVKKVRIQAMFNTDKEVDRENDAFEMLIVSTNLLGANQDICLVPQAPTGTVTSTIFETELHDVPINGRYNFRVRASNNNDSAGVSSSFGVHITCWG